MSKSLLRFMVLCAPLMLVSCGEGWEMQRVENVSPYGSRTAGSGVAYVRAKMLPEKELKVEPITAVEPAPEPVVEAAPALDAEKIFNEAQTKGGAPMKKEAAPAAAPEAEKHSSSGYQNKAVAEKVAAMGGGNNDVLAEVEKTESSASSKAKGVDLSGLSAEAYIQQEPKKMATLTEDTAKDNLAAEQAELQAAAMNVANVMPAAHFDADVDNVIEVHENKVVKPAKEIISPKNDYFDFKSKGQYDLDDIYADPFSDL